MSFSLATYSNDVLSSAPLPSIHNVSASPLSPPPTPYHPTSTFSLFHSISFAIENPDAQISTTSLVPTTTSNSTLCLLHQAIKTFHAIFYHVLCYIHLLLCFLDVYVLFFLIRQPSFLRPLHFTLPQKLLKTFKFFQDMTKENVPLSPPPSILSSPIPFTFKLTVDVHPHSPYVPPIFLPLSHITPNPPLLYLHHPPFFPLITSAPS